MNETVNPIRIQRRRTAGWTMPPNTVYVGRPSVFGNPFRWQAAREVGYIGTDDELRRFAVRVFREWLTDNRRYGHGQEGSLYELMRRLNELRGKNLACWCPLDRPCHADVLLEIANR